MLGYVPSTYKERKKRLEESRGLIKVVKDHESTPAVVNPPEGVHEDGGAWGTARESLKCTRSANLCLWTKNTDFLKFFGRSLARE